MKITGLFMAAVVFTSLMAAEEPADMVLRGGAVYTLDAVRTWAQAVAVRRGRIVFVGSDREAAGPRRVPRTRRGRSPAAWWFPASRMRTFTR